MSPDDFSLPPDDGPLGTGDAEGGFDHPADGPDNLDGLDPDDATGSDEGGRIGEESAVPDAGIESLFGAGGALELSPDPAGDRELARWLDAPAEPDQSQGLSEFTESLGRRLRGE